MFHCEMMRLSRILLCLMLCAGLPAVHAEVTPAAAPPEEAPAMANEIDSISYCLGLAFGQSLRSAELEDLNLDVAAYAIWLGMQNQSLASFSVEATKDYMQRVAQSRQQKKDSENLEAGRTFLEQNMSRVGVIVRPSGLQYQILTDGTGPHPSATDLVTIQFYGTLIDGTVFERASAEGTPVQLYIEDVIPGLAEALQLMKVGSSWMVYIPSDLAYGDQPPTDLIAPNSTLICQVELLSIDFEED